MRVELTRSVLADALLDVGCDFVIIIAVVQVVSAGDSVIIEDSFDIVVTHSDAFGLHFVELRSVLADNCEVEVVHRDNRVGFADG